jgi:hypothetical protein
MGGDPTENSLSIGTAGLIGSAIIEATAGGAFWLYSQTAKQFSAFHICLERTHRYLLAYKIASEIGERKDDTFRDLVCIMANAPMIDQSKESSPTTPVGKP